MQQPQQPQQPVQKKPPVQWFWWIFAIILLIWNIVAFLPKSRPEINIPYSKFLSQVSEKNIASVTISGSEITGKFIKQYPGPQPTLLPSQTVDPNATPVPPILYTDFFTTFPEVQGDP